MRWKLTRAGGDQGSAGGVNHIVDHLSDSAFLELAYEMVLGRAIDPQARDVRTKALADGSSTRAAVLSELRHSVELMSMTELHRVGSALHVGRAQFVRSLPRARRILDLGGADRLDERGALVSIGYPYDFEELVIVDLPNLARHPVYRSDNLPEEVVCARGPIRYRYHPMHDLSSYPDDSFDLIFCGQSFEHITCDEGAVLLGSVSRVLAPGGHLALDTPNREATAIELAGTGQEFIDPDHKVEYRHDELLAMFQVAGLEVVRSHGVSWLGDGFAHRGVDAIDLVAAPGLHDDVTNCYILAYVLRPAF